MIVTVRFPPSNNDCQPKTRKRRAWYDTLLGGYGSLTGTLNGFDIETLANRMHNLGKLNQEAITLQARWMPTVYIPAEREAIISTLQNQIQNQALHLLKDMSTNLTAFVNWTSCTLQTLYLQQQKSSMQTMLMTGNEQVWRTLLELYIPENSWVHLEAAKLLCNDIICAGKVVHYNVTQSTKMCKYIVLPLLLGFPGEEWYWQPHFNGDYIDSKNKTHDLSNCIETLQGKVCKLQSAVYEPCLLQNTVAVCDFTILHPKQYTMLIEIAPQEVCVVTNTAIVPGMKTPFVGCVANLSAMVWENETFVLYHEIEEQVNLHWQPKEMQVTNWDINLDKLQRLLKDSEQVRAHIQMLNKSIVSHVVSAIITGDRLMKIGSQMKEATEHHWWDLFLGYSPSAQDALNWFIHPMIFLLIGFFLLTVGNCVIAYKIWCRRPGYRDI